LAGRIVGESASRGHAYMYNLKHLGLIGNKKDLE